MRILKYIFDRKSLEIIYFSFLRPILEYADVVWDQIDKKGLIRKRCNMKE